MPAVDVVIPCYNYARYLPRCVESVLGQEGVAVRVLIIDDCSSDDSEATGRGLAALDRRVEFRRHAVNQGHIATYNEGLMEWASADYSVLLSADDALAPGALVRATRLMTDHPEVGMTCGRGRVVWDDDDCPTTAQAPPADYRIVPGEDFLERCFAFGNVVCTPTAVVRTRLQKRLGGYRADLPHSGDMEMWMRFAVYAPVGILASVQAYYRRHGANMSQQYDRRLLGDRLEVLRAGEEILARWAGQYAEADRWRKMMVERLARESCWEASCALTEGDVEGYRACLAFAARLSPEIRRSPAWLKARIKGALGPGTWRCLKGALERLRTFRGAPSGQPAPGGARPDQVTGWWPG